MSTPNLDHSVVYYDTDGAPTRWTDANGDVFMGQPPLYLTVQNPPRHRSPIGIMHPGHVRSCAWCNNLSDGDTMRYEPQNADDSALDRCGHNGGSRPAIPQTPAHRPDWSQRLLTVLLVVSSALLVVAFAVVVVCQVIALRSVN